MRGTAMPQEVVNPEPFTTLNGQGFYGHFMVTLVPLAA
jgi:hypothetical protein